jgi:hypothetical protein
MSAKGNISIMPKAIGMAGKRPTNMPAMIPAKRVTMVEISINVVFL